MDSYMMIVVDVIWRYDVLMKCYEATLTGCLPEGETDFLILELRSYDVEIFGSRYLLLRGDRKPKFEVVIQCYSESVPDEEKGHHPGAIWTPKGYIIPDTNLEAEERVSIYIQNQFMVLDDIYYTNLRHMRECPQDAKFKHHMHEYFTYDEMEYIKE